jgi:hypothetical protein
MQVTVSELREMIAEAIISERAGDIEFSKEANRIHGEILAAIKKNKNVLTPNFYNKDMQEWDGVHTSLEDLGITDVPDIMKDLILTFTWGEDLPSGFFIMPSPKFPSGIIGTNYDGPIPQGAKADKATKRSYADVEKHMGGRVIEVDEDMIPYVAGLFALKKTTFIHELRHAYDVLVRDDDGKMAQHMNNLTDKTADDPKLSYVGDDEFNAHVITAIEDTINDFKRVARNRPTKAKAKKWAPNGTALWKKFKDNLNMGVVQFSDEKKLLKRAGGRLVSMWDDYVEGLPE